MSKTKNLLISIEDRLISGVPYEDVITYVQDMTKCNTVSAKQLVDTVEGDLCMADERDYWGEEIRIPDEDNWMF
jgi:hypothetical protein